MSILDTEGRTPITIDFNEDTFNSLCHKILEDGKIPEDFEVILTHEQFQTFKIMYRFTENIIDPDTLLFKSYNREPTTMGSVYGLQYHVE